MQANKQILKVAVLGALLGVAGLANAAVPAGSLPGSFQSSVSATYAGSGSTGTITFNSTSPQVMQWGGTPGFSGKAITAPAGVTTNAGMDVGQGASLTITNQASKGSGLLLIDATGNPSEIAGSLINSGTPEGIFVANSNGVTVDGTATISGPSGAAIIFLGYLPDAKTFLSTNSVTIDGSTPTNNGDVTIAPGANLTGISTLLVAGNGNVNIGASNVSGTNSANHLFTIDAGAGVNITTNIAQTNTIINPKAVLTVNGGTAGSPVIADMMASGGTINVTGALGGDPAFHGGELVMSAPTAINIAKGGSISGGILLMGQYNQVFAGNTPQQPTPQSAPNITIAGTLNATVAIQFDGANNVYETGSGTVNMTGSSNIYANLYGNLANPSGGQAHGGDWRWNGFVVNVAQQGTVGLVVNPLSLGAKQQFINIAVNGNANLYNWGMVGTIPTNLLASPLSAGGSATAQTPSVISPDHMVVTANNFMLGNSNYNALNYYFPGLLALVTGSPSDPTTVGGGMIVAQGNLSNMVPWSIPNGGGLYFITNQPLNVAAGATVLTNTNSYVNFAMGSGLAAQAAQAAGNGLLNRAVFFGNQIMTVQIPSNGTYAYSGWNNPNGPQPGK